MFDQNSSPTSSPSAFGKDQIQILKDQIQAPQHKLKDKSSSKSIQVTPATLEFTNITSALGQTYTQTITLQNTLSAPVQLFLKCSSEERLSVEPSKLKLAPHETSRLVEVRLKLIRPLPINRGKPSQQPLKETLFIKSDFFDQKVPILIQPPTQSAITMKIGHESKQNRRIILDEKQPHSLTIPRKVVSIEEEMQETASEDDSQVLDQMEVEALRVRLRSAQEETEQVKIMLAEARNELSTTQQEQNNELLGEIRGLLTSREPNLDEILDLALKNERTQQERKDLKVLEILNAKDTQLEELQGQLQHERSEKESFADQSRTFSSQLHSYEQKTQQLEQEIAERSNTLSFDRTGGNQMIQNPQNAFAQVRDLEDQLLTFRQSLAQQNQSEAFFEEAYTRQKRDLLEVRDKLEQTELQLKSTRDLVRKVDTEMRVAYDALEKVTGEQSQNQSGEAESQNDISLIGAHAQQVLQGSSEIYLAEQLSCRSQEVVYVFEQLHSQYTELEKKINENRQPLKHKNSQEIAVQSSLMSGDIEQMQEHYENVSKRAQAQQLENETLKDQITQYKFECERLRNGANSSITDDNVGDEIYSYVDHRSSLGGGPAHGARYTSEIKRGNNQVHGDEQIRIDEICQQLDNQNLSQETFVALNQKLADMKGREDQLLEQLSVMKQQLYLKTNSTTDDLKSKITKSGLQLQSVDGSRAESADTMHPISGFTLSQHGNDPRNQQSLQLLQLRVGELEAVIFRQHEQLINLEENNITLKYDLQETTRQKENKLELLNLRNRNLEELSKKYQESAQNASAAISGTADLFGAITQTAANSSSALGAGFSSMPSSAAAGATIERHRQNAQSLELSNMELSHRIHEQSAIYEQLHSENSTLKETLQRFEIEMAHQRQGDLLAKAGLNGQDSRLAVLVHEQRSRIRQLEQELTHSIQNRQDPSNESGSTDHRPGGLQANDFYALKEEYCTKLEQLNEQHASELESLHGKIVRQKQRNENLKTSLKQMESKEVRVFSQLEEVRAQLSRQNEAHETRLHDRETLLETRNQTINELEREAKQKERVLAERQEQLSVLLSAMESYQTQRTGSQIGSTNDDNLRQKLANLAAELCSLKAVESQMERKASDAAHRENKLQTQVKKLENDYSDGQTIQQDQYRKIKGLTARLEQLDREKFDLSSQVSEFAREQNDHKYKHERLYFQLKVKEETIMQLKSQVRKGEGHFRQQIDQIKEDLISQQRLSKAQEQPHVDHRVKGEVSLKIALQQLHIAISDFLERACRQSAPLQADIAQHTLVQEMEKALGVGAQTVQRLEGELERERQKCMQLENEWEAVKLNGILISRQEKLIDQLQILNRIAIKRETETNSHYKTQLEASQKVVRECECKLEHSNKNIRKQDEELEQLRATHNKMAVERDELANVVSRFQQERASSQSALERKAEISVDERFRNRSDSIRSYFDSQITKILMGTGEVDKALQLGREICALQLLVDKLQRQMSSEQGEKEALQMNLKYYKDQLCQQDQNVKELTSKVSQATEKIHSASNAAYMELDKKKQEVLDLEKQLITERETGEAKARDVVALSQQQTTNFADQLKKLDQQYDKKDKSWDAREKLNRHVQQLQEQLLDIRSAHLQELEEMKTQCDLELAEVKRHQAVQRENFEQQFLPGTAPGDILAQNYKLQEQLDKLQSVRQSDYKDSNKLRQQIQSQVQLIDDQNVELQSLKKTLGDVQQNMQNGYCSANPHFQSQSSIEHVQSQSSSRKPKAEPIQKDASGFKFTPPQIIQSLLNAKLGEQQAKARLKKALLTESKLNAALSQHFDDYISREILSHLGGEAMNTSEQALVLENLLNQISIQNENIQNQLRGTAIKKEPQEDKFDRTAKTEHSDYDLLVGTLVYMCHQLTGLQSGKDQFVEDEDDLLIFDSSPDAFTKVIEAQRMVIRALSPNKQDRISYAPERDIDRKIWYLELLESQVAEADTQIAKLQDFIKRLQIGVSGSLHSAAEIKAASMDLTQHTKTAAQEVKSLKHVASLIKHDVLQQAQPSRKTGTGTIHGAYNPFIDAENGQSTGRSSHHGTSQKILAASDLQQTARSNLEKLVQENEMAQNQLSLTSKIKQSLEGELVQSKLQHAQELQILIEKFSHAEKALTDKDVQIKNLQVTHSKHKQSESQWHEKQDTLQSEISKTNSALQDMKQTDTKNKSTSKHLQRLQTDMSEWRKQSDQNLRLKQEQIDQLREQLEKASLEKEKKQAENSMLRKNQKSFMNGEQLTLLSEANNQLQEKIKMTDIDRQKEVEFWVQERTHMRDKIDQLESQGRGLLGKAYRSDDHEEPEHDGEAKKVQNKQIRQLQNELKRKESQMVEVQNELAQQKLETVRLEKVIREIQQDRQTIEKQFMLVKKEYLETKTERDLIREQKRRVVMDSDQGAREVSEELEALQSAFAKVKIDRDTLVTNISEYEAKEREWRSTLEQVGQEMARLEGSITQKENEATQSLRTLEQKNGALITDLRFLRTENEKMQSKLQDAQQQVLRVDGDLALGSQQQDDLQIHVDDLVRQLQGMRQKGNQKEQENCVLKAEVQAQEVQTYQKVKQLSKQLASIKIEQQQLQSLTEKQVMTLRDKLVGEKKATAKELDSYLQVTQKDNQMKQLKRDLTQSKQKVAKLKATNANLKEQLNVEIKPVKPVPHGRNARKEVPEQNELVDQLLKVDGLQKMLAATKQLNEVEVQLVEFQANLAQATTQQYSLKQQLEEKDLQIEDLKDDIDDLNKAQKDVQKQTKTQYTHAERQLKDQAKNLKADNELLKKDWFSPQQVQELMEQIQHQQGQMKALQLEVGRKAKLVTQLKAQKDNGEIETNNVLSELSSLKDASQKSQRAQKESQKLERLVRDLRSQIDFSTQQEKGMKAEIANLNEKVRSLKIDVTRKDTMVKDIRDKMEVQKDDLGGVRQLKSEIESEREKQKKFKLDCEIKENQIRSLKMRLEQNEEEIQQSRRQQDYNIDGQLKLAKQKIKKQEAFLKKALLALKSIGLQLAHMQVEQEHTQNDGADLPMLMSEIGKDKQEQYYKDSVQILGLGMNELEMFVNPMSTAQKQTSASAGKYGLSHTQTNQTHNKAAFEARLDKLVTLDVSEFGTREFEIDEIGEQCMKMLHDIDNATKSLQQSH